MRSSSGTASTQPAPLPPIRGRTRDSPRSSRACSPAPRWTSAAATAATHCGSPARGGGSLPSMCRLLPSSVLPPSQPRTAWTNGSRPRGTTCVSPFPTAHSTSSVFTTCTPLSTWTEGRTARGCARLASGRTAAGRRPWFRRSLVVGPGDPLPGPAGCRCRYRLGPVDVEGRAGRCVPSPCDRPAGADGRGHRPRADHPSRRPSRRSPRKGRMTPLTHRRDAPPSGQRDRGSARRPRGHPPRTDGRHHRMLAPPPTHIGNST
ncbi:hypothetical protein SATRM34S_00314 [Streptomyces atroolivaceus]